MFATVKDKLLAGDHVSTDDLKTFLRIVDDALNALPRVPEYALVYADLEALKAKARTIVRARQNFLDRAVAS
jgi:hypothetical protein